MGDIIHSLCFAPNYKVYVKLVRWIIDSSTAAQQRTSVQENTRSVFLYKEVDLVKSDR